MIMGNSMPKWFVGAPPRDAVAAAAVFGRWIGCLSD
jgi:hypothetical protein